MLVHRLAFRSASCLGALILTVVAGLGLATPAAAAAPPNDDFANATPIPGVPFSATLDTSEATPDADPNLEGCSGGTGSVWYTFTAPFFGDWDVVDTGSDYTPLFTWYATEPFVYPFACGQGTMRQNLLGGVTYYLQVAGAGGHLEFAVQEPVYTELTVTLDPVATLGRGGDATVTVSGTVACTLDGLATVDGVITQKVGAKKEATGAFGMHLHANGVEPDRYRRPVQSQARHCDGDCQRLRHVLGQLRLQQDGDPHGDDPPLGSSAAAQASHRAGYRVPVYGAQVDALGTGGLA
jgi:hypothetical protein